jgi:hypothetical protein
VSGADAAVAETEEGGGAADGGDDSPAPASCRLPPSAQAPCVRRSRTMVLETGVAAENDAGVSSGQLRYALLQVGVDRPRTLRRRLVAAGERCAHAGDDIGGSVSASRPASAAWLGVSARASSSNR